ncbi:hypothetical protein ACFU9Y_39265 [Streptomyces sp. NPDC057621]
MRIARTTVAVVGVGVHAGRVRDLRLVVNPDRLHAWTDAEPG